MIGDIKIKNLSKKYKRYKSHWARLAEWMTFGVYVTHHYRWALKNIDFEVKSGESIGIIGQNGAGKSTLLKILTGTAQPTTGEVYHEGRIAALLELGLGFHPNFTGKSNALMTCRMMGLSSMESNRLISGIEEFSELGDYMDQPMRVYSTGMQVRLAFSAATVKRGDILIVDEALSVGDAYFQHKCIKRIRAFKEQGTTLLFVSHDPSAVKSLCDRALLLDRGRLIKDGTPDSILDYYNGLVAKRNLDEEIKQVEMESGVVSTRSGSGKARFSSVEIVRENGEPSRAFRVGDRVKIQCEIEFKAFLEMPTVGIMIRDRFGNDVFGTNTFHLNTLKEDFNKDERVAITFTLDLNLGCGNYSLSTAVHSGYTHLEESHDWWDQCLVFQVVPGKSFAFVGISSLPVGVEFQRR